MLREEFSRLIYLYQQAAEGDMAATKQIFEKSIQFVQDLQQQLKVGDEEDRKAAMRMMNELYQHMKNATKLLCEKSGQTEEQLMQSSENPRNFTPEGWKQLQESRKKLAESGQELIKLIHDRPELKKARATPEAMIAKEEIAKKGLKKKGSKKSDWMRS